MLTGAEQIEARRQRLQDQQRHEHRRDAAETAERIDAAEEAGEHGDQQQRFTLPRRAPN